MAVRPLTTRRIPDREGGQPAPPGWADAASRLLPATLVVVLWLGVIPPSGGYFPRTWYPAALGSVLLFCVLCLTGRRALPAATSIPVMIVSAKELTAEDVLTLNGHIQRFVAKGSIEPEGLTNAVRQLLGQSKTQGAAA